MASSGSEQARFSYKADNTLYSLAFSTRKDTTLRMAVGTLETPEAENAEHKNRVRPPLSPKMLDKFDYFAIFGIRFILCFLGRYHPVERREGRSG